MTCLLAGDMALALGMAVKVGRLTGTNRIFGQPACDHAWMNASRSLLMISEWVANIP